MSAKKDNVKDNKPPYRYLTKYMLDQAAYAHQAGANKYGPFNFMAGGLTALQLLEAIERHIQLIKIGEDFDQDCTDRAGVNVHHMGCIAANVNMYLSLFATGKLIDDRPPELKQRKEEPCEDN